MNKKAFTIMEVMIVVVIVSVISSMALPSYYNIIAQASENDAKIQLETIRLALRMYQNNTGGYVPNNLNTTSDVNNALGINLIENKMTYSCISNINSFDCRATSANFGWALHVESAWADGDPHCFAGSCPTCSFTSCP